MQGHITEKKGFFDMMIDEIQTQNDNIAMERMVAFWKRKMPEQILIEFGAESDATLEAVKTVGKVSKDVKPLYDDVPKMLEDFENSIGVQDKKDHADIGDDSVRIPIAWPELQFGNGMGGAVFGAQVTTVSTVDHTYTFNEPLVKEWSQIRDLKFSKDNHWVKRILDCLKYFRDHGKKEFLIRPFFIYEGADFIVSMRGTTQAFYDLIDQPRELFALYEIGRDAGIEFFELKSQIIKGHNENIIRNQAYSDIAPIHSVPMLDMDAYALCSPEIFEKIGFENKQKILDHFGGGSFYIHALGRAIVPIAAELENLTELWLFDDPKCPRYFEERIKWRKVTNDIPLQFYCELDEFIKALDEHTLPGGTKYNIFSGTGNVSQRQKSQIAKKAKAYRTKRYNARPKKDVL